jgi:2-isopropylmalate synthase
MNTANKTHITIFDTTLRDGQQCPGAAMSFEHNLEYARLACAAHVDVLEAGFPAASRLDFSIVQSIANELAAESRSPVVAGLCQQRREQVEQTMEALSPALTKKRARVHMYLPVAPGLMEASLGSRAERKNELVEETYALCQLSSEAGFEVEFSPEGYSRIGENFDFTTDVIRAALQGGASVINCPDTIGGGCWLEGDQYFVAMMNRHAERMALEFPEREIIWSAHCHNDFGLALHNSLAAIFSGPCRQIEGCFNGIGERAGNVALEQVIMAIEHFGKLGASGSMYTTGIELTKLQELSNFVARYMLPRQPHWPITGENAARHSSGGHTNAILHDPLAYQPFDPRKIGTEITFVFGPLSGGNHAQSIIEKAGYICRDDEKAAIAQFIKTMYQERRKGVTDLEVIQGYFEYRKPIRIDEYEYFKRANHSEIMLTGTFFEHHGDLRESYDGKDSALACVKRAIDSRMPGLQLINYHSESASPGISAMSVSTIILKDDSGQSFTGKGEDEDIEISAMKALIAATNRAYVEKHFSRAATI